MPSAGFKIQQRKHMLELILIKLNTHIQERTRKKNPTKHQTNALSYSLEKIFSLLF